MFHVHVQCFNSTTWFTSMYYIYLLHVYTDKLSDLPFTEVPQPTKKTQDNKATTEKVISGRPVAHSTPIPSEVLSECDDDLIYMGMDTGDSADDDTANDIIIIDEDKQKPAQQQKQEASMKTEEQAATPVQEQGQGKHEEKPALSQR